MTRGWGVVYTCGVEEGYSGTVVEYGLVLVFVACSLFCVCVGLRENVVICGEEC